MKELYMPSSTSNRQATGKKTFTYIAAVCGGCGCISFFIFTLLVIIGSAMGPIEPTPETTTTPNVVSPSPTTPTPEPTTSPAPSSEPLPSPTTKAQATHSATTTAVPSPSQTTTTQTTKPTHSVRQTTSPKPKKAPEKLVPFKSNEPDEPSRKAPTSAPKPRKEKTEENGNSGSTVHPGAYCANEGATGITKKGKIKVCKTAKDDRLRWQSP